MDRSPATLQKQLSNNAHTIIELIKYKQQELELDNSDTVIIGFSQGTMVGLYLTLIASEPFAALVGFSGRLIQPSSCVNKSTPICLLHGEDDDIVPVESIDEIADYLRVNQVQFEAHKLSNLTHSIDARGIELACNFLKSNLYIPT
jgi:phospholipase/carboxylesterase